MMKEEGINVKTLFMYICCHIKICFLSIQKFFQLTYNSQKLHNGIRTYDSDQNVLPLTYLLAVKFTLGLGGQFKPRDILNFL